MCDVAITVFAKIALRSVCKCYSAVLLCDPNNAHMYPQRSQLLRRAFTSNMI